VLSVASSFNPSICQYLLSVVFTLLQSSSNLHALFYRNLGVSCFQSRRRNRKCISNNNFLFL
jgi:hypothetical protein